MVRWFARYIAAQLQIPNADILPIFETLPNIALQPAIRFQWEFFLGDKSYMYLDSELFSTLNLAVFMLRHLNILRSTVKFGEFQHGLPPKGALSLVMAANIVIDCIYISVDEVNRLGFCMRCEY